VFITGWKQKYGLPRIGTKIGLEERVMNELGGIDKG
jgi:hypothetical protein